MSLDPLQLGPFRAAKTFIDGCTKWVAEDTSMTRLCDAIYLISDWQTNAENSGIASVIAQSQEGSELWTALIISHNAAMRIVRVLHAQYFYWLVGGKERWAFVWDASEN